MKKCTKCGLEKAFELFSKNAKAVDGLQQHCKACKLAYQRNNPKRSEVTKKYYEANRAECNARSILSQQKKREYYNAKMRAWTAANKTRHLATRRAHYADNAATDIERVRRRQKRIRNVANLSRAERAEIGGFYLFCRIFKGYEVDHIVPLNGEAVSGLHVPCNLQAIPISANRSKGNKFMEHPHDH